ncbi:MAG: 30S ribosomal protein S4 [Gemmatimonadetes bacterium]|nr:30S ribosomal protein S4 [Gemmatimonadota bacterium]
MSDYAVPKVPKTPIWGTYKSKSTGENVKSCQTEESCHDRNLGRPNHNDLNSQILEKQKLQFNYGLKEKHLNRLMIESTKSDKETGEKLAELVERRLDNVVFRSGFARSMPQARQIITQKHIQVNGEIINIASHRISIGDVIGPKPTSQNLELIKEAIAIQRFSKPDWLECNYAEGKARVISYPGLDSLPFEIDIGRIVEYYARKG